MAGRSGPVRPSLTREQVLAAAAALVKQHGPGALTMRKLAAELGTAVTSIYWHVGNRESLLEALVERTVVELGAITPRGRTPAARVVSVARALRRRLLDHPHLIAMVHERGLTERMFQPAARALVDEVHAAGLRGAPAAEAVRAVLFQAVGFVLVERNRARSPVQRPGEQELWDIQGAGEGADDPALARALARGPQPDKLFTVSVRALVDGLLNTPPSTPPKASPRTSESTPPSAPPSTPPSAP
ncbi:TetR/AcrR family transcriptional regulator [Streptomyces cavernicola]|uniref:TetR/AcrR family transcriptional regulator n=1 Tax=Streptomyces cavernicola TaxID=3043613 RepID=A0ABT6S9T9_9ACTN|nr:TetR/AcrR family transcriptional regulator [Streptomyces sp. B-S-A6]MDI3404922.1 TetR/AcrR family transcriptional regulator [Streptomyces sp. B-S-A6]